MTATENTPINDLRDAVDALTKPIRAAYMQHAVSAKTATSKSARVEGILKRDDRPLLEQLQAAISNSLGAGGGAGKAAHERTPFDVAAFTLFEDIDGRVRSWMLDAGERALSTTETGDVLRRWYVLWIQKVIPDSLIEAHIVILKRWRTAITDLLDPPYVEDLTAPCPLCGQVWALVGHGEEKTRMRALSATWRHDADDSFGLCRACLTVWNGVAAMRRMRSAVDDADMYERSTTVGPRRRWKDELTPPDEREGWEFDTSRSSLGVNRFEDRTERYWRRPKDTEAASA